MSEEGSGRESQMDEVRGHRSVGSGRGGGAG